MKKEIDGLEENKNQAIAFLHLEKQIYQLKNLRSQVRKYALRIQLQQEEQQKVELIEKKDSFHRQITQLREENKELINRIKENKQQGQLNQQKLSEKEVVYDKIKIDFDNVKRKMVSINEQLQNIENQSWNLQKELNKAINGNGEHFHQIKQCQTELTLFLEESNGMQEEVERERSKYKKEISEITHQINCLKKERV